MNNLIKNLAKQYPYKKSNLMAAIEIQDGYMVWIKDMETNIYRFYTSSEELEAIKEESENFSLEDFILHNTKLLKNYLGLLNEEIVNQENGNPKGNYYCLEVNKFSNYFDKNNYTLVGHNYSDRNTVTLDDMKKIREFFLQCIASMTKRCTTYWKKYGNAKLKWHIRENWM